MSAKTKTTNELLDAYEADHQINTILPRVTTKVEEPEVFGTNKKKWSDTIALQALNVSYEILKVGGSLTPEEVMDMTVRDLLEKVTPNKLRLKLERI